MNFDYITPIKAQLDEAMHQTCVNFMLIGFPVETPRYYNFSEFDSDTKILRIASSQRPSKLFFDIQTNYNFNHIDSQEFWSQFKEYRTNFLLTNYPTINAY